MILSPPAATSSSSYQSLFDSALDAYRKKTRNNIISHPLLTKIESCDSPEAILTTLGEFLGSDQALRSNDESTAWLSSTVRVLQAFSSTISSCFGLTYPPAAAIFTGIGVLLSATTAGSTKQDIRIDIFERIENFFRRLEVYIEVQTTPEMVEIMVKIMVEILSILAIATIEVKQSKTKTFLKKLVGRTDIEEGLRRLDKLTRDEAWMVAVQGLKATQCVRDGMKAIENKVIEGGEKTTDAIEDLVSNLSVLNRNQLRQDLRRWLCPPDPSVNHNVTSAIHHKGTATWFIECGSFMDWKASGSLLWVHGKPGSGKSILSSAIIQDVEHISNAGLASMAYFYFDFKDIGKQTLRDLLTSLLIQLSDQSNFFCDVLLRLYSAHRDGSQQPADTALVQSLQKMITTAGTVPIYLIIDALDECPDTSGLQSSREKVLELVEDLLQLHNSNLRLCITSRPEIDIRTSLEQWSSESSFISLHDQTGQREDIINYIRSIVYSDRKMKRWRTEDKESVIETLSDRAEGMFRWVSCQLETLRRCLAPSVRQILGELPETLDETYKRILQEIPKSNRTHTHRLLQCLTVAFRPLHVEELAEVIAVDFDAAGTIPKLSGDLRWEDQEQAILSACSSLITVVEVGGSRVVQFSHFSVKEFLTSDRIASKDYHILLEPAHTIIAQACLGVLVCLDQYIDEESISGNKFPLARYAADHVVDHMEFGDVLSRIPDEIDYFLDADKPHFAAWLWLRESLSWGRSPEALPLYYVAEFGFCGLVKHLILKRSRDSSTRGPHGMPLHVALRKGHATISRLLLDCCEDVDVRDPSNQTPLHLAAEGGFVDVIRILLDRNAEINVRDNRGRTPLLRAITWTNFGSYADEVGHSLEQEVDAGTQNTSQSVPPRLALSNGSVGATKLLLDNGANVHIRDDKGQTPLHRASDGSHVDVMRLLLQHDAGLDEQDNSCSTALHLASDLGSLEAVRLLLENGANPNIRNDKGQTPLHLASEWNHVERTRLLLECGADVNVQDNDQSTPLHLASYHKSLEAAQLLLEHGASIDVQNNDSRTPLHLASESDQGEMVQLLLGLSSLSPAVAIEMTAI